MPDRPPPAFAVATADAALDFHAVKIGQLRKSDPAGAGVSASNPADYLRPVRPKRNSPLFPPLTENLATSLAQTALGHIERELPHKLDHVLAGPDLRGPRELHPIFFGSFDWHSCVHAYWTLARLGRRFPGFAPRAEIETLFLRRLTKANVAAECAYFEAATARGFERPYGWAWLLKLAAELAARPDEPWFARLAPLAELIAKRFRDFLPRAPYPQRAGSHANTAFALRLAADYAASAGDDALFALLAETGRRWYGGDADGRAWGEPSLDDFLSPTLMEAECARRLWPAEEFAPWLAAFWPRGAPAALFEPALAGDRTDGKMAHLDGLNLSRAWCWRSLAPHLSGNEAALASAAAERALAAALPHVAAHYMGEHWLASFVVLAVDDDSPSGYSSSSLSGTS